MTGQSFKRLLSTAFEPFLKEFGFKGEEAHISGRYYRGIYVADKYKLLISFEPGDNFFSIRLVNREDDTLAAMDDPIRMPRLSDLNLRYRSQISMEERSENERFFANFDLRDVEEKELLNCAKELRLVLPKFFDEKRNK